MDHLCRECRFFALFSGQQQGSGQCRRYPPTLPTSLRTEEVDPPLRAGIWPIVAGESWCGEYQTREATNES